MWAWRFAWGSSFFERDDSPDRLSLSDSRKDPRGNPGAARSTKATQPLLAPLLVAIGLLPLGLEAKGASGLSDDFTPLVRRLMARDQIPGVAGLVERGRLVFARGFGYRDASTHLPVTPDTLFALGSCSKAFTATAIALLADEGKSRSTLPSARTFPTLPSKIRWRRRL